MTPDLFSRTGPNREGTRARFRDGISTRITRAGDSVESPFSESPILACVNRAGYPVATGGTSAESLLKIGRLTSRDANRPYNCDTRRGTSSLRHRQQPRSVKVKEEQDGPTTSSRRALILLGFKFTIKC